MAQDIWWLDLSPRLGDQHHGCYVIPGRFSIVNFRAQHVWRLIWDVRNEV